MPGGVISIRDNWGTQKETAASGGRGRADGCAAPLNVAVSDLPSFSFLHIKMTCGRVLTARLTDLPLGSGHDWRPTHQPWVTLGQHLPDLHFLQESKG